jgi:hypothetical protein
MLIIKKHKKNISSQNSTQHTKTLYLQKINFKPLSLNIASQLQLPYSFPLPAGLG